MQTLDSLLSTQQALAVVQRRFPLIRAPWQLTRQVRLGALRVAAKHGRKYWYRLDDLLTFTPHYIGQGRNARPPLWNGHGLTVREAAAKLGLRRGQLLHLIAKGVVQAELVQGAYRIAEEEIERTKGEIE